MVVAGDHVFGPQIDKGQQLCPAGLLNERGIACFNTMGKEQRRKHQAYERCP